MRCFLALTLATALLPAQAQDPQHEPKQHASRFHTDRAKPRLLPLPKEDRVFHFVIYGDRTGGPRAGVRVLEQAVADTNLLDPDLVMTVGDLVEGYNETQPWLEEMREFREVMGRLRMPWFPVAGNHDIYYRGKGKTPGEHEGSYEKHFGPLWYAFDHKQCTFLVLYTDEANPKDGSRDFRKHENHTMSRAQLAWLRTALKRAAASRHVFVFLHHPRWVERRYGKGWEEIHQVLAAAGNVRAVFAGHIHRMRYDGARDGIEYYALATTGGHLSAEIPGAGFLHHFNVVTVRDEGLRVATVPVGTVLDPKEISGAVSEDIARLNEKLTARSGEELAVAITGAALANSTITVANPCRRPIEITVTPTSTDRRWSFRPDHRHTTIAPGETGTVRFRMQRPAAPWDVNFALPTARLQCDYLGEGLRVSLPERVVEFRIATPAFAAPRAEASPDTALALDGRTACARLASAGLDLADGPITVEGWVRGESFQGRRALVSKAESSEFGLFVSGGKPSFSVHLDGKYAIATAPKPLLRTGTWHHVAGVFDGEEVRLYVDGRLLATTPAGGERKRNRHPLLIGADPDGKGKPVSFFAGHIDEVRISPTARYDGARFRPKRACQPDDDTALLLHFDSPRGPWFLDAGPSARHPRAIGSATIAELPRRIVR